MDWNDILDPTTVPGFIASILSGALLIGLYFVWRAVKGRLERVLGQTENSHEDTEYPNLRDEVTAIRLIAEETAKTSAETAAVVNTLASSVADDRRASRTETEGVRADVRPLAGRPDLPIAPADAQRPGAPPQSPTKAN